MALKNKIDYFQLSSFGWEVSDTSENRSIGYYATAEDYAGFIVATASGGENMAPQANYVATSNATINDVALGQIFKIDGDNIALGGITINTAAGSAPTLQATGQKIEDYEIPEGTTDYLPCRVQLDNLSVEGTFHAQTFGLFTVENGQLTDSSLTFNTNIATAILDGEIKASDLVGGTLQINGTIIGVNNQGVISRPTVTITQNLPEYVHGGVFTQPLTETNPNGDFPTYTFTVEFPLREHSQQIAPEPN